MGANYVEYNLDGDLSEQALQAQFDRMQDEDRYENGHGAYSGSIGVARGLTIHGNMHFDDPGLAADWLDQNCQKWEAALAVRFRHPDGRDWWKVGAICSS